jgi:hypothetical protein
MFWQGPEAIVQVNYKPFLSSDGVLKIKKLQLSDRRENSDQKFQMGARHQDTLAD